MVKVYIDGQEGTTGLKIFERLGERKDIELLRIDEDKRKDSAERKRLINSSDFTFLCLPDAAAIEAVSLVENDNVRIIDASTAHRTNPDWAYGFPELSAELRKKIEGSKRVAVPGCYASGFASLIYPLVKCGIIAADYPVSAHAISGYSGAGKKGIAQYENPDRTPDFDSPREYAIAGNHKHVPEMMKISGLDFAPVFNPYVCDFFNGMTVSAPLFRRLMKKQMSAAELQAFYADYYKDAYFLSVKDAPESGFIPANTLAGTNMMEIFVAGNDERLLCVSRLDNLGKGASGAAVQCFNIMNGIDEKTGLI